ncbi:hypothetical protein G7046_g7712 [Stylonectria norvegica]|nr:hypothetical protein G7046_g7712 [Stylonectria norvegica]
MMIDFKEGPRGGVDRLPIWPMPPIAATQLLQKYPSSDVETTAAVQAEATHLRASRSLAHPDYSRNRNLKSPMPPPRFIEYPLYGDGGYSSRSLACIRRKGMPVGAHALQGWSTGEEVHSRPRSQTAWSDPVITSAANERAQPESQVSMTLSMQAYLRVNSSALGTLPNVGCRLPMISTAWGRSGYPDAVDAPSARLILGELILAQPRCVLDIDSDIDSVGSCWNERGGARYRASRPRLAGVE